jgi:hypothetical protein
LNGRHLIWNGYHEEAQRELFGMRHMASEVFLEQLGHQFHRCGFIAASLHEQVENLAFVVNRAPKPELPPRNRYGHLIEMPTQCWPVGVDGEVLGRTMYRTSKPIAAPFRRRCPDRAAHTAKRRA